MIAINIDVTKIDKTALYDGKKGKYLSLTLRENKDGRDKYGNDGFVTQDIGKERRAKGERGAILGNYKTIGGLIGEPSQHQQSKQDGYQSPGKGWEDEECDEIPF